MVVVVVADQFPGVRCKMAYTRVIGSPRERFRPTPGISCPMKPHLEHSSCGRVSLMPLLDFAAR